MPDSIDIGDVVFSYGAAPVLRGVSLAVSRGEIVLIGGRSGHGTSTLLEIIVGLLRPQSGRVRWDGADLASMDNATLLKSRQSIGYVFQGNALISSFTVFDNIALPLRNMPGMKAEEVRARVRAGMETMALFNIDTKFPESLSSGQSKMVAIT
ncbi:MAG: ATP-binding cassette domain-containing protein, partial [Chitinispirillaceae bacterium]|nr:ATP-binding cassette domain-containing protein [Chitinispirillaceae bacterium]